MLVGSDALPGLDLRDKEEGEVHWEGLHNLLRTPEDYKANLLINGMPRDETLPEDGDAFFEVFDALMDRIANDRVTLNAPTDSPRLMRLFAPAPSEDEGVLRNAFEDADQDQLEELFCDLEDRRTFNALFEGWYSQEYLEGLPDVSVNPLFEVLTPDTTPAPPATVLEWVGEMTLAQYDELRSTIAPVGSTLVEGTVTSATDTSVVLQFEAEPPAEDPTGLRFALIEEDGAAIVRTILRYDADTLTAELDVGVSPDPDQPFVILSDEADGAEEMKKAFELLANRAHLRNGAPEDVARIEGPFDARTITEALNEFPGVIIKRNLLRYHGLMTPAEGQALAGQAQLSDADRAAIHALFEASLSRGLQGRELKIRARKGSARPSGMYPFTTESFTTSTSEA